VVIIAAAKADFSDFENMSLPFIKLALWNQTNAARAHCTSYFDKKSPLRQHVLANRRDL